MSILNPSLSDADGKQWSDNKRLLWLFGLLVPSLPFMAYGLVQATGLSLFWWFGPLFIYGVIAVADLFVGVDDVNPPQTVMQKLEDDNYYRWVVAAFMPVQYIGLIFSCWVVSRGNMTALDIVGFALTVGFGNGVAIANAHELGHKPVAWEQWLAKIVLAPTGYGHFVIEHNRGHHVRVATPEDPATARMGENFWLFLPRSTIHGMKSGWKLEADRLARSGRSAWSFDNDVLNAWIMTPILFLALVLWFGPSVLPFLIMQGIFGFSLLEVTNFIEHYGLLRQRQPDGRYERCQPEHSWNSNHIATNLLLYHLQRHSDHHANPLRRYQTLRHFDDSPQLPTGYAGMTLVAYFPPLWRWIMDKRVVEHYKGDLSRINIHPSMRDAIYARWGNAQQQMQAEQQRSA